MLGSLGKKSLRNLPVTCLAIEETEKGVALLHIFQYGTKKRCKGFHVLEKTLRRRNAWKNLEVWKKIEHLDGEVQEPFEPTTEGVHEMTVY